MAFEIKEGTFSLFNNNNKEAGDNKPAYTGKGKYNGEEFAVAVWENETKSGDVYFSGTIKAPYVAEKRFDNIKREEEEEEDELPF